jgi:MFS transporter, SP family, galactose:H+ symporter
MIFQQLSGINTVIFYSKNIFSSVGFSNSSIATIIIGFINVLSTVIVVKYIDSFGRKPILYTGILIMFTSLIILASLFKIQENGYILSNIMESTILITTFIYVASFGMSVGPVTSIICAEIFPLEVRDIGLGITTIFQWITCISVTLYPLTVIHLFGISNLFFFFAFCCFSGFFLILFFSPETKGLSLEEIENKLKNNIKLKNIKKI